MTPLLPIVTLFALTPPVGPPRWMETTWAGGRPDTAQEKKLRDFVGVVRALPLLNPPPGVYPKATLSVEPNESKRAVRGSVMLGFWPERSVALRGGALRPTSAIVHLMVYVNYIREESLTQDKWRDGQGLLFPQPAKLGDVQGFPVYQGFGGSEVSGILAIQPPGRALFAPVSQERFRRFAITRLEKELREAQPALVRARELYAAVTSPEGRQRRERAVKQSLEDYKNKRPRTPEQLEYREKELLRMDLEEEERLRIDSTPEGNRLVGPLSVKLARERAALAALPPGERATPAWHLPDSRETGPHPVPAQTPGAIPIVALARWDDPARPRSAWQLVTIERYWMSAQAVRRGLDRRPGNLPDHLNKEVVEAIDWKAFARRFLTP